MVTSYMDYTSPDVEYFFDINRNRLNTRNAENFINRLGRDNLNTLGNTSLLDIYLSRGHVIEPHYHQNASELVYCISGSAIVSLINPFTNQVANIPIAPGQVANIPQGWWHWEIASQNKTHLLAIFDAPYPEYIFGSDLLTKTPIEVLAYTYCLDPHLLKQALAPLQGPSIVIGPTDECLQSNIYGPKKSNSHPLPKDHNMPQNPYAQDSRYTTEHFPSSVNGPLSPPTLPAISASGFFSYIL